MFAGLLGGATYPQAALAKAWVQLAYGAHHDAITGSESDQVYLDLLKKVPYFTDVNDSRTSRVEQALRALTLMIADEPEVAAACTTALLSNGDQAVRTVRDRIGAEIHRRSTGSTPRVAASAVATSFRASASSASGEREA